MNEKEFLDRVFEGVDDCGFTPIEITDSNFNDVKADIDDSLAGLLANAGIAVAEQKKLLQSARTPIGLQTALKLMGVTVGNLLHASTSMLGWMGKTLNKDEACVGIDLLKEFSKRIDVLFSKMSRKDSVPGKEEFELHYQVVTNGILYSVIYRVNTEDWIIVVGYNNVYGTWDSILGSYDTFSEAEIALKNMVE